MQATIKLIDNYTKPMRAVISNTRLYQSVANKIKPLVLKAKDMASKVITPIKAKIDQIKSIPQVQTVLKAIDMASKITRSVFTGLKKIGGMVVSATVKVLDKASSVLSGISGKLSALAGGVTIGVALKTGFQGLTEEETQKITINRVVENSGRSKDEAKKSTQEYYKYLEDYANKTPFTTQEITQFGTKGMMMAKGKVDSAKQYTDAMANVKAFVGDMRTSQEVAEAFFSAQNGNMESLNNILGENYKTFDSAMEGIKKKQGGLVDEMSQTTGGLFSTIVGKATNGAKNFVKAFEGPLKSGLKGVISFIDFASEGLVNFATRLANIDLGGLFASFDFGIVLSALQPVVNLMNDFFTGIETKSPVTMGIMQVLGSVWNFVWNGIGSVVSAVTPIVQSIMKFIGKHGQEISMIIDTLGAIWKAVWKTVGTLLQGAWKICEPILSFLLRSLSKVSGVVQDICTWWNKMVDLLKTPINAVVNVSKKIFGGGKDKDGGRSAFGTNRVPRNDMPYRLHQGERVLTRQEADRYDKGSYGNGFTVQVNGLTVREEADVKRIARQIVKEMNKSLMGGMA